MGLGEEAGARDAGPEFELCYLDADGGEHRELPAAWPGLRPETFMPAREFRWARSQKHLPGLWWSVTTGSHVGYESWLERDHVMLLDFDPQVTAIASQPFWLRWRDGGGRSRRHAPDFFARMADGTGLVIDVRPDDRIEEKDAEAFAADKDACGLAGWGFRRSGVPDPVLAANVRGWRVTGTRGAPARRAWPRRLLEVFAGPVPLMAGAAAAGDPMAVLPVLVPPDVAARADCGPGRQAAGGDSRRRRRRLPGGAAVTGRPGGLGIGDRVRFDGRDQVVIGVSGTSVRLADAAGEVATVTVSDLLAARGFAVLDARPRPGVPQVSAAGRACPEAAAEEARWWERHIVEVLTGLPPDAADGTVPRPEYDPRLGHADPRGSRPRQPS